MPPPFVRPLGLFAESKILTLGIRQTMMNGFRAMGWIKEKSDSAKMLLEFLPFVYTRDEEDYTWWISSGRISSSASF
jgi:hypothetical protein